MQYTSGKDLRQVMKELNYRKLKGSWKQMFDLCAFKKTDSNDMNEFKLKFNNELLKIFLKDQSNRVSRGMSACSKIASELYEKLEKEFYASKDTEINISNILNLTESSDYVTFNYKKAIGSYYYSYIIVKLILSTLNMSEVDKTFLSANLGVTFDDDSSTCAIAVATLPIMKKEINHEWVESWAKETIKDFLLEHYKSIHKESNLQEYSKPFSEKVKYLMKDFYIKQFI